MMAVAADVGVLAQSVDTAENTDSSTSAETRVVRPKFHKPGFRCFIGNKYELGAELWDFSRSTIYAVAGYQANPYLFVGAGASYSSWHIQDCVSVSLFADMRVELHKAIRRRVSPYVELQVGYVKSSYLSPQLGCHFNMGRRPIGISVALSYSVQYADISNVLTHEMERVTADAYGLATGLDF